MGAGVGHGASKARALRPGRRASALALLVLALGLSGCGADVQARRAELLDGASRRIVGDLEAACARALDALGRARTLAAPLGTDAALRLAALDALRRESRVDGILWEGPGGETGWAGRPLDPPSLPPPPPWRGTFRSGDVTVHQGPYVRAVLAGPTPVQGGYLTATVYLEESAPGRLERPFEARWLEPLGLERVDVLPLDASAPAEPAETRRETVRRPDGEPLLLVDLVGPGSGALLDRLAEAYRGRVGAALLVLWTLVLLGLVLWIRRATRSTPARLLALGLLAPAARTALDGIDLPQRFPALAPAFDAAAFGVADPLGWLASPADLVLTAVAFLLLACALAASVLRLPSDMRPSRRIPALVTGLLFAAAAGALWVAVVEVAVLQGQTRFFEAPSLLPPVPAALMLVGLVTATAAAWLLATAGLSLAARATPRRAVRVLLVLVAAAGALLLALPTEHPWAPLLLVLTAGPLLFARGEEPGMALPSRILLVSVLATGLLFPLLWERTRERATSFLSTKVETLLRAEAATLSAVQLDLPALAEDPDVVAGLGVARGGLAPEGLAFHVWLRSFLSAPGEHGEASVLDAAGRVIDRFSLTPLPRRYVPPAAPPAEGAGDVEVLTARGESDGVRSVIGRARVRASDGEPLGSVVLTAPDRLDLTLLGLETLVGEMPRAPTAEGERSDPLQYAIVREGLVERANDPGVPRLAGAFGPAALARLDAAHPTLAWENEEEEGYAAWSAERGAVVAVRREATGVTDVVMALSRLVVVGVGLGALLALLVLVAGLPRFRMRLHHRILLSYFAISFVPIVILGWTSAREIRLRHDAYLAERLETDVGRARSDLEAMGPQVFDRATNANLVQWANQRRHDVLLYRDGYAVAGSRAGLVEAELLPSRLPPDAYRATVLEGREIVRREAAFVGFPVWFGYAPVLDAAGRTVATVGVPLLYDRDVIEEQLAVAGSVLVAAYLLTLVFVLVVGIYAARRLTRPLGLLAAGTRRVAAGELDVQLPPGGTDELGELVRSFNQMTRDLREATARAVRAERETAWRRMARQVAHEIKNPLTPMRLMVQQLVADVERNPAGAEEAIRRTAAVVLRQIETLGRIAGDFATFARLPKRTVRPLDAGELVREVVELYSGSAAEGVRVEADVGSDLPIVHADEEELRRVLVNLVGNAVQAIPGEGRVTVRARRAARGRDDGVRVEVEDTGTGIPAENLPRLFEPGFSTKTSGTGLGLAIVRRAVDDLGGTIEVDTTPGRGTTFTMFWPAGRPPQRTD